MVGYAGVMLHAFIDESEYKDKYFILTALIVEDEKLQTLDNELATLVFDYFLETDVKADAELHGYDLLQQKGDWESVHMNIAASIYKKALGIINEHGAALYIEVIDREAQRRRYRYPYNHRKLAIGYILEKVNSYANCRGETVKAYLDDHYTAPEGRKEFIEYKATGTFGYKSSKLLNIEEMEFYDSRTLYGLQASDLCCYIYQRHLCAEKAHPRAKKLQDKLWSIFADLRARGYTRIWP
ncbi:DUF3800 domain-containing protein [Corynebacterium diphtheriae]|uniref:DUF3800 domain-containing protein n=1 Tax=Corynebacterium diphtheriae TaxID=1717 RepID=UPI0008935417|nr:DUF3800 domain-containing protein [Corynebacterium diphtheriae]MBG9336946.1 DUF3800 domain-containing protein [Corynebacterium diphtheriae bv. gravis]OFI53620.1 hypothetical protein BKD82_03600 [Corynebacterium diphtheriae]OFI62949.1 hypothetical protein BKD87_03595 [Corynebacterium diphtheriae]OSQ18834.1 hypothetical protein B1A54_06170 [Corynebacterium diphtheriae]CAB0541157.1 hypothetical protein CIP107532_00116 [Corynebacterium diphtheriae]